MLRGLATALTILLLAACGSDDDAATARGPMPEECERAAAAALLTCLDRASGAAASCYARDGAICADDDPVVVAALTAAGEEVRATCDDSLVQEAAGFGPQITEAALADRVESACRAESASLAARTFGGPQGAAWQEADDEQRGCLTTAQTIGLDAISQITNTHATCLDEDAGCDTLGNDVAAIVDSAQHAVETACNDLSALVAVDPATYVLRAAVQAECVTATTRPGASTLGLECGPRDSIVRAPRGEYIEIILDSEIWGTRCGDGSPFAFQLRLAPDGSPVENIMIAMEGGGVCLFEDDCSRISDDLFEAMGDTAPTSGIMSNDPAESPFANWSKAYLPYCNQDVFIGGGATNVFDNGLTIHRFGAINVRAALRYIRDVIWRELDENTQDGYRPDRMRVFFGGFSAGGFGTLYNYHYVLDDLQWVHTTAFPDAALALDSGGALSVGALGAILIPESDVGWSSLPYLPPYCFDFDCGVGPIGLEAMLPRLKAVPEQQLLVLTNQIDAVQIGTTFFNSTANWVNEMRFQYCRFKDEDGVKAYMPAIPESRHVISPSPDLYSNNFVDGTLMVDWLWGAVTDPDDVVNRVEEGTLVDAFPGVEPFPCEVAP